ncbi:MAG: redoxin domain-containing protein, partial [Proteobacteria bacterium]|nr:redoxin domain-containing protein [Pseudomonadota bacterium]
MNTTRIAMLLGSAALIASCAGDEHAMNALSSATPTAAMASTRVDNFMLVDQNLEAHELYRLADAPAIVLVTQQNGDAVVQKLAPQINKIAADYGAKRVEFMMINSSLKDSMESIQAEATKAGYKVPVLMDDKQIIGESLGVTRSAEALVINPKTWTVTYRGAVSGLPGALDDLLGGKTAPVAGPASAGAQIAFGGATKVSYAKDVAPILEAKCVACHEDGGIGPMAFNNYAMVKGFAPMIREVIRTDRMPPYHADPRVGHFSDSKRLSPDEIKTIVHWVDAGAPRGEGTDPLGAVKHVAEAWPLGKPDLILNIPSYKVPASGVVDYQRPFTVNPTTEGHWIRATSVKPGDRQAVHHVLTGWIPQVPAGKTSNEGMWRQSVGRYAVGSEADVFDGDVGTFLPPGGAVGFQMHYTPYGKETTDSSEIGVYFRKNPPKYIMRQTVISDPGIDIPANAGHHMEMAYQEFPKDALLYDAFVHAHYRATASDLWLQTPDGKKKLLLALPRYDFNWQRAYTFAEPVKIPAGSRLIARYWYDNSKRNPHNPDPNIEVTWGEQSFQEMLFTQVDFRWMDETAVKQVDSDSRFADTRLIGFLDKDLDGKIEKSELRGQ